MAALDDLAASIFGGRRAETNSVLMDGTTHTYVGTATSDSQDGHVMVELSGDVTNPDPVEIDGETYYADASTSVELPTSVAVQEGDEVLVSVYGGSTLKSPVVTANVGSGDRIAQAAEEAETLAGEAWEVAEAVGQHVWTDDNGLHITEITQEEWEVQPSGANQLMNSNGTLIRDGETNRTASTPSGYAIYDGSGNEAENIAALFSSSMARIGSTTGSRTVMQADGAYFYDSAGAQAAAIKSGAVMEQYRHAFFGLTYENGVAEYLFPVKSVTVEEQGETYFVVPVRLTITCEAGRSRILIPYYGTYDGTYVTVTLTEQTGGMKLVVTERTPSANPYEMGGSAEYVGLFPTPSYEFGVNTSASGNGAMALGVGTIASIDRQLAIGAYNREYDGPFVIGNGGSDGQRINIFTVDWSGNIWSNGKATLAKAIQAASAKITGALSFGGNLTVGSDTFTTEQAAVALGQPCFTATGSATSTTASALGWQLTYFNTIKDQDPTREWTKYLTFSNGRITATSNVMIEISGAMDWSDAIAGIRGFGVFKNSAVGGGQAYERSAFQQFPAANSNHKTVVFPPQVIWLSAGDYLNIGRYQQANAVYRDGANYSWVTVRILNATA